MTVVINLYFVALWIYYFVLVQIRVHFTLIQRILKCFSIDLEDIEDYEQDLQRWNQLQEKLKKTQYPKHPQKTKMKKREVILQKTA